ncbi:hypothetical protein D8770_25630 [Methylobacterium sp. DB1607]|nr:hypothetical protein [Methylobacterium sp. DB1607]
MELHRADEFGDQEVEVGVALAVSVGADVDRHAIDADGDVGAVVEVDRAGGGCGERGSRRRRPAPGARGRTSPGARRPSERRRSSRVRRPPALLRRAAIHEAGHALVAALERGTEHLVVALQDRDRAAGWVDYAGEPSQVGTRSEIEGMLRILLAGCAAEIEMLGEPSAGARGDLTAATNLAVAALGCWGLGSSTLVALDQDPAQRLLLDARLHGEAAVLLGAIAEEAADLVYRSGSAVMRIAEALLTERRLDGARVAELLHEPGGVATDERIAARGAA